MELFAGFLAHADAQIGRLIDYLEDLENRPLVIFVLLDNGASAEGGRDRIGEREISSSTPCPRASRITSKKIDELGGPDSYNHYPFGWTMAGNTPFKKWMLETHLGGIRDPLIVHWPRGESWTPKGEIRTQYAHAIDLVPTVLEDLRGVSEAPAVDQWRGPRARSKA